MKPATRQRHPFKAIVAVVAMFIVVHGLCAHAGTRGADVARIHVVDHSSSHPDCDRDDDDDDAIDEFFTDLDDDDAKPSTVIVTVNG